MIRTIAKWGIVGTVALAGLIWLTGVPWGVAARAVGGGARDAIYRNLPKDAQLRVAEGYLEELAAKREGFAKALEGANEKRAKAEAVAEKARTEAQTHAAAVTEIERRLAAAPQEPTIIIGPERFARPKVEEELKRLKERLTHAEAVSEQLREHALAIQRIADELERGRRQLEIEIERAKCKIELARIQQEATELLAVLMEPLMGSATWQNYVAKIDEITKTYHREYARLLGQMEKSAAVASSPVLRALQSEWTAGATRSGSAPLASTTQ